MKKELIAVAICIGLIGLSFGSSCSVDYDEKVPEENITENTVLTRATIECPKCGRYISDLGPCMYCSGSAVYGYHCKSCKGNNVTPPYGDFKGSCNNCGSNPNWKGLAPCTGIPCSVCHKTPSDGGVPSLPSYSIGEANYILAEASSDVVKVINPDPYIQAFRYDGVVMELSYEKSKLFITFSGPKDITATCYTVFAREISYYGLECRIISYQ